jgi:N-acetylornithine carbamoyltransferase
MPSPRHFINTDEWPADALTRLLERARAFKRGATDRPLVGKSVALVFMNPSLRTRVSMEVAVAQLGGHSVTVDAGAAWKLEFAEGAVMDADRAEHVKDAARVLSRYVAAIAVRCFPGLANRQEDRADPVIEGFRAYATVPVINMESARWHPCQAMADAMTIVERFGGVAGRKVVLAWTYHPKPLPTAVPNSFATIMKQLGADLVVARPPGFALELDVPQVDALKLDGAQVVYAKSWAAPLVYEDAAAEARLRAEHKAWRIADTKGAVFMHCLPVRRNVEVTDAVLDASAVYDEAENRLHVQKAILEALLAR